MQLTFNWPVPPNVYWLPETLLGKQTKLTFLDQEWPAKVIAVKLAGDLIAEITLDIEEFGDVE